VSAAYVPTACYCKGAYVCDLHRLPPPPPPAGACVLCHRIEPAENLITGKGGVKWHDACANDVVGRG
jgi:hypothetical protein